MSLNVLVIPEDFRKDQYLLRPIVERMFRELGRRAQVRVCQDPLLGGIGEALKWERIAEILDRYRGMVRLFLLVVDRDANPGRRAALDGLEARARTTLGGGGRAFLAENAWQELEVWALAGFEDLPAGWAWRDVRAAPNPKETYYLEYAAQRGYAGAAHAGREILGREAASRYPRIRQLCPEDVHALEDRVRHVLEE